MKVIDVDGIPVEVERKRVKTMRIVVKAPDAVVHVTVPWFLGYADAENFVRRKMDWVQKQRARILAMPKPEALNPMEALARLRPILVERIPCWATKFGESGFTWGVRQMKTRWGSCNYVKRNITFNLELARVPLECIDYVIVHELCHFLVPNHGPQFKALMTARFPSWPSCRATLKNYTPLR